MITVESTNPVFRANCRKSVMCLYEVSSIMISDTINHVKKSRKNTVRLRSLSPSMKPNVHDENE